MAAFLSVVVALAVLCLAPTSVLGLRCLMCQDITKPFMCTHITTCDQNEACGLEQYLDPDGFTRFNLGCKSAKTCADYRNMTNSKQTKSSNSGSVTALCQDCCDSDICNSAGCGEAGFPTDFGPVCFNCENIQHPEQCTRINICEENEICFVEEVVQFHIHWYKSKCQRKHICDALKEGPSLIGRKRKRSLRHKEKRSAVLCHSCCHDNLCNDQCGKPQDLTTGPISVPDVDSTTVPTRMSSTSVSTTSTQSPSTTSKGVGGQKFILAFLKNLYTGTLYTQCLITSELAGSLQIEVPFLNISDVKTLNVGLNIVNLSRSLSVDDSFQIEQKAVYIETTTNVNVYAMNFGRYASDGFKVIPIDHLSTEYIVVSEEPLYQGSPSFYSEVLIVATQNNTDIMFKFNTNGTINYKGIQYGNNKDLTISLDKYETFRIEHERDLTGTFIVANKPIAVFSGNRCGNVFVSGFCSHLSVMLPPITSLGQKHIMPIFQSPYFVGQYLRIISTRNNTFVNYTANGQTQRFHLKQARRDVSKLFAKNEFVFLTSTQPVLVSVLVQRNGSSGPFMAIVPSVDRYLSKYTFAVPSAGFSSFGHIIIKSSYAPGLYLDGNLLNRSCSVVKTVFLSEQYCIIELPLTTGYHSIYHGMGHTFGLWIYGYRHDDGYGFSAGMEL